MPVIQKIGNELGETRAYRRDANREQAWKFWGEGTRNGQARSELSVHARRAARLKQVLRLAKAAGQSAAAERALELLDYENVRHERAMKALLAAGTARKP